ncbi:MAG TPA: hypothetical protein VK059_03590 [Nocardioidaceae bacterium]|nr:hypothetical protein [Nocardioidaceae bacterium]
MNDAQTSRWRADLERRWTEHHRHHHDLSHLHDVLAALDVLREAGESFDVDVVRRAAWFHDAIYDPRRDDNEERSARLALDLLGSDENAVEVARLVRVTRTHEADPDDANAAALCDADLSVLASDELRYRQYADGVRREYAHVPDAQFAHARAAILRGLLRRPSLFSTPTGRTRWESDARANLTTEIAELLD